MRRFVIFSFVICFFFSSSNVLLKYLTSHSRSQVGDSQSILNEKIYVFSFFSKYGINFVELSVATINNQVARGSRVHVCQIFFAFSFFLRTLRTQNELYQMGLFTI